ncbi:FAD-dependent oxidoreductase [Algibacter mikhailovii]|uniref:FAD-dependent oxidoreductase n=1 Tax=Algibacter mikhailovii TaxID=425498 RepID=UPI0024955D92|nr:FAD-dependent oxidoreductase [Algibacter mikhailovii]
MKHLIDLTDRSCDQWTKMGSIENPTPIREKNLTTQIAVIGGGMAGICAAVAAARNGVKVILVQDRAVLGGNASSEIRVIVHGVTKLKSGLPERETGILEEILLLNRFYNEQHSFTVWDHVLYDFVTRESNITLMLNTQCIRSITKDSKIESVLCWQLATETLIRINAEQFIDCSGDGLMAATAGALYRTGREGKDEFNEKYAPDAPDGWQMGATILLSSKDMGKSMPYKSPPFTIKFDAEKTHPDRRIIPFVEGFWWVEVGSKNDIIADAEVDMHRLMGFAYGVWDYVKNSGKFPEADTFALDWVGSLPGRRESRRFIGDYILSEPDQINHKIHDDAVAFGGWPLDEHNPGGIENLAQPPSFWHEHFDKVYQIPYKSLYSKNITNLSFAGRNVSQTHVALSSSRVMGTCAVMGQAVGTAASLCIKKGVSPRTIANKHVIELQEQLMRDDAYIPERPAKDPLDLARTANNISASSTLSGDVNLLIDGVSRDELGEIHHWQSKGLDAEVIFEWNNPIAISSVEIKCDTNVKKNIMMLKNTRENQSYTTIIPPELIKSISLELKIDGIWQNYGTQNDNQRRLIKFNFDNKEITAFKIKAHDTYGAENIKLFEVRCYNK